MNILPKYHLKTGRRTNSPQRSENGMATLIFITLLAIMMILVTAEAGALAHLHREVKFLERQQLKRLNSLPANAVPRAPSPGKTNSP